MSKEKDRNESTTVILREFNCELIDKLKKFTGEKTNTKAIELVCARYLSLEKLADDQKHQINDLDTVIDGVVRNLRKRNEANKYLDKFLDDMEFRI